MNQSDGALAEAVGVYAYNLLKKYPFDIMYFFETDEKYMDNFIASIGFEIATSGLGSNIKNKYYSPAWLKDIKTYHVLL